MVSLYKESFMSETNLEEMSLDELDSLLSESEGKSKPKPETDVKAEPEPDKAVDSEVDSSTVEEEDSKPEAEEEPEGKPEEEEKVDEEDSIEPQYRGKSKADILEMQRNANRKISQQNNEIYHLKKRMEEIYQSQEKRVEEKVKVDPLDEIRERYAEEDLNAIETLVNRAMLKKDAAIQEEKQAQREAIMKEHDDLWENFKLFNPALHEKVGPEAIRLMKADESSTYQRKGWLREFIAESSKGAAEVKPVQKSVVKKRTPTISGGGGAGSSGKINKSVEEMSPDEFLQHSLSKGIKI